MAKSASTFVDPGLNSNSGSGTLGDPFGDLQYALDSIARDTTNGDQINIKSGTPETLTASLSLTTYGTPTLAAPLVFRGYSVDENDSGIAEINANGNSLFDNNYSYIQLVDLEFHTFGTSEPIKLGSYCKIINCEIHGSTHSSYAVELSSYAEIIHCNIYDVLSFAVQVNLGGRVLWNDLSAVKGVRLTSSHNVCMGNKIKTINGIGVEIKSSVQHIIGNSFYDTDTGTSRGIYSQIASRGWLTFIDNVFAGYNVGIDVGSNERATVINNHFFNCNTSVDAQSAQILDNNSDLAGSPFADAPGDDWTPSGELAAIKGMSGLTPGAIQVSGGGNIIVIED